MKKQQSLRTLDPSTRHARVHKPRAGAAGHIESDSTLLIVLEVEMRKDRVWRRIRVQAGAARPIWISRLALARLGLRFQPTVKFPAGVRAHMPDED